MLRTTSACGRIARDVGEAGSPLGPAPCASTFATSAALPAAAATAAAPRGPFDGERSWIRNEPPLVVTPSDGPPAAPAVLLAVASPLAALLPLLPRPSSDPDRPPVVREGVASAVGPCTTDPAVTAKE